MTLLKPPLVGRLGAVLCMYKPMDNVTSSMEKMRINGAFLGIIHVDGHSMPIFWCAAYVQYLYVLTIFLLPTHGGRKKL